MKETTKTRQYIFEEIIKKAKNMITYELDKSDLNGEVNIDISIKDK